MLTYYFPIEIKKKICWVSGRNQKGTWGHVLENRKECNKRTTREKQKENVIHLLRSVSLFFMPMLEWRSWLLGEWSTSNPLLENSSWLNLLAWNLFFFISAAESLPFLDEESVLQYASSLKIRMWIDTRTEMRIKYNSKPKKPKE